MSEKELIRRMSNKELIETINKIRKEKANPEIYGKYGSSKWVTSSEFWTGHHGDLKAELKRRQTIGKIKKTAGKPQISKSKGVFGSNLRMPKFRF